MWVVFKKKLEIVNELSKFSYRSNFLRFLHTTEFDLMDKKRVCFKNIISLKKRSISDFKCFFFYYFLKTETGTIIFAADIIIWSCYFVFNYFIG